MEHVNAWAIERAPHQAEVLRRRFGMRVEGDVYDCGRHNLDRVDVFVAGFPCQPFSVAGRRGGERDPRNLWPEIARIVEEIQPPVCVFENVPALRNPHPAGVVDESEDGEAVASGDALPGYLGTVLGDLVDLGYHVAWDGRSAANAGAWHRRDRVWIVAWKVGQVADFDPFRPEDVVMDAREIGRWDGTGWGLGDLFGSIPVVKWPRAGIVRGAVAFEVGTAATADERTAWTTPTVGGANHRTQYAQGGSPLPYQVDQACGPLWQTPTVGNVTGGNKRRGGERGGADLRTAAHESMWNTARTTDAKGSGPLGSSSQRSRLAHQQLDAQVIESMQKSGLLNPGWVEALMGYPPGWSDLDVHELTACARDAWAAWGPDRFTVGDLEGTNPEYASHWLWHPALGALEPPLAKRQPQTKTRLISLGNAWVPQAAVPIMARVGQALTREKKIATRA